jgi:hypothetical protein
VDEPPPVALKVSCCDVLTGVVLIVIVTLSLGVPLVTVIVTVPLTVELAVALTDTFGVIGDVGFMIPFALELV